MNNEPVALTQGDILGILQDANSVPCGQPIFNSSEEYNKLKAIIESAIRYTHPAELTDEEIEELWYDPRFIGDPVAFGKAVLRATKNIPLQTDEEICKKCDALTERAILRKAQENG